MYDGPLLQHRKAYEGLSSCCGRSLCALDLTCPESSPACLAAYLGPRAALCRHVRSSIVPLLGEEVCYMVSESSLHHVLRQHGQRAHCGGGEAVGPPTIHIAQAPRAVRLLGNGAPDGQRGEALVPPVPNSERSQRLRDARRRTRLGRRFRATVRLRASLQRHPLHRSCATHAGSLTRSDYVTKARPFGDRLVQSPTPLAGSD